MAAVAVLALAATTMVGVSSASAAPLTDASWSVSNNQAGATDVTYTYSFTTATTGVINYVSADISADTGTGDVGVGAVYGLGAGSAGRSGDTLMYVLTTPVSVAAGTLVYIEFTDVTNTATVGTTDAGLSTLDFDVTQIDGGSVSATFASASTAVTVQVAKSLTFTNDTPSFTLAMDPSLPALSDTSKAVTVSVKTNAGLGYTLAAKDTGLVSGANTIPAASTGTATGVATAVFAANTFGVSAVKTIVGGSLAAVQGAGLSVAGNFVGYTTAGQSLVSATKPTGNTADILVLTNRVKIDYTTAPGKYTDVITYTATPLY